MTYTGWAVAFLADANTPAHEPRVVPHPVERAQDLLPHRAVGVDPEAPPVDRQHTRQVMVVVMMFMFVLIMIVMMVLMLLIVVMAAAALVVVMMMVMMLFLFYLRKVDDGTFHRIEYFLTTQYFNRCGNNVCFRIQFAEHFYSCLYFFRIGFIGTAQDDGSCALYLILEEFAEVSEIHFAFHNVDYGCCGIQGYACFFFYTVYSLDDVGEFTYAGRLDDDAVRVIFGDNVF